MSMDQVATFGGGCFWCIEAAMNKVKGVHKAVSGYAGGRRPNPTYQQVITGTTGHAEVIQVSYDADIISYESLLEMFFQLHDPTTLNRQGNDIGTQYRSIILFHNDVQKVTAESVIKRLTASNVWHDPIVTELQTYSTFYPAEDYHQGYAEANPEQPYCALLIGPKLNAFKQKFSDSLK